MKKLLVMIVAAMMATTSVQAQNGYEDTKHEVGVSYGYLSNSQWIDIFEEMTLIIFGSNLDNETFIGPISAEYFYRAKKWLGVGGILTYGHSTQDVVSGKEKIKEGSASNTYITLMPAVKFDWLRKRYFGMYSKLAVGATLRSESVDYINPKYDNYSESALHVNWQVSLLGLEFGSPKVRGFFELGSGEQGTTIFGLRYKF